MVVTRREFGITMLAAAARPAPIHELTAFLQQQIDAKVAPGVKVAARLNDKPFVEIFLGTYCDQHRRDNPCDWQAVHSLASVSKMVTATAVVMAWQEGLIDLDAPVVKYIPEFGAHGKDKITIRQCLTHTAGIPTAPAGKWVDTDEHWNETLALICDKQLEFEPGSRTMYHGSTGPMVAAAIVRRKSGNKSWHAICKERVFDPLGLSSLTFELPPPDVPVVMLPSPKDLTLGAKIYRNGVNNPGGGLMGNIGDILKFLRFHTRGGITPDGKRLLEERYWKEMHTNQFANKPGPSKDAGYESWGLGMMLRPDIGKGNTSWLGNPAAGPHVFSHAGISTALAVGDPDTKLELAILTTDAPTPVNRANEIRMKSIDGVFAAIA